MTRSATSQAGARIAARMARVCTAAPRVNEAVMKAIGATRMSTGQPSTIGPRNAATTAAPHRSAIVMR